MAEKKLHVIPTSENEQILKRFWWPENARVANKSFNSLCLAPFNLNKLKVNHLKQRKQLKTVQIRKKNMILRFETKTLSSCTTPAKNNMLKLKKSFKLYFIPIFLNLSNCGISKITIPTFWYWNFFSCQANISPTFSWMTFHKTSNLGNSMSLI